MARKRPIVVMFFHHWDDPAHRENSVNAIRSVTDLYEKHHVCAHYGFVGAVLQQLAEDSPETITKIKRMHMAIGYHGGAGHAPVGPAGHPKDTRAMSWAETVQAMWQFETHTLDVVTHEPIPGKIGGYLAIQSILGVIPLPTDAKGTGQMNNPGEFVLARMGAGSYPIQAPFGQDAIILSPMHEPQLFPGSSMGWPPTYYGKAHGEGAPRMADPVEWFGTLAENLPEERTFVVPCMTHSGFLLADLDRILKYLAGHPESFTVTHPDPESAQWKPENSASGFYRRVYGVHNLVEVLGMVKPPQPGEVSLTSIEISKASEAVLTNSVLNTHDGDFAEPPEFIDLGRRRLSLASAFQGMAASLKEWKETGRLPDEVTLPFIHGPIDSPRYERKVSPALPNIQFIGYTPVELAASEVPDADIINSQGLPPAGDYNMWMPTQTLANGEDVIDSATRLDLTEHIPGVIWLLLSSEDSRQGEERKEEMAVNPAEFLYAMAQVYRQIVRTGQSGPVALVNIKVAAIQRTECTLIKPGGPRDSFIWRSDLSPDELDIAWTRVPTAGEERVLWMSLPPLGDKVKRKMGRPVSEWQLKKR